MTDPHGPDQLKQIAAGEGAVEQDDVNGVSGEPRAHCPAIVEHVDHLMFVFECHRECFCYSAVIVHDEEAHWPAREGSRLRRYYAGRNRRTITSYRHLKSRGLRADEVCQC